VSGLVLATRYLTVVPLGRGRVEVDDAALARAVPWFPIVGLGIGAVLAGVDRLTSLLFPGLLAALLTITVWKLLTGGLHLDGLADTLDGLGGSDAAQRLRIMGDSRIGAFGAIGLILFLLLEIAAVAEIGPGPRWRALLVAPVVGRAMPALLASLFPAARADGQGARFHGAARTPHAALGLLAAAAVAGLTLATPGLVALMVATGIAVAAGAFLARRLGGTTGDVFGAVVELTELAVLLVVVAGTRP
jgi:adenosylcobinamide-GDP ribazoletransferase